jgi:hypothetical protein
VCAGAAGPPPRGRRGGGWQLVAAQVAGVVRLVVAVVWALVLAKVPGCDRKPCGGDCTGLVPEVLIAGLPPVPADLELRLRLVVRIPRERAIHWLVAVLVSFLRAVDYAGTRNVGHGVAEERQIVSI